MKYKLVLTIATLLLMVSNSVLSESLFHKPSKQSSMQVDVASIKKNQPGVRNAEVVEINTFALNKDVLQMNLNDLSVFSRISSTGITKSGGVVWIGDIALTSDSEVLDKANSVTLINRNGMITGTIRVKGRLFKISPQKDGLHLILEIDESSLPVEDATPPLSKSRNEFDSYLGDTSNDDEIETTDKTYVETAAATTTTPIIKLLVLYANGVTGEVVDIEGLIDLAILETNQGYSNSGINATVELAYQAPIGYTVTSSMETDLNRLVSTSDTYMKNAHILRTSVGADAVIMLVPTSNEYCGMANQIGSKYSTAFAIVSQQCATGHYTFAHELGHLLSARHDPTTDSSNSPYAYGHGYKAPDKSFRTVMAYDCTPSCGRVNFWSNPDKIYNGQSMGTSSQSDNARVLDITASKMAVFSTDPSTNKTCQYDSIFSSIVEFNQGYMGYDEGRWWFEWEGNTIGEEISDVYTVQSPSYIILDGFKYTKGPLVSTNGSNGNHDDFSIEYSWQICRAPV